MQAQKNLPHSPKKKQPILAWDQDHAVMLLPELQRCAGSDSMHSLFVNRNGHTLCCFCDEERLLRVLP